MIERTLIALEAFIIMILLATIIWNFLKSNQKKARYREAISAYVKETGKPYFESTRNIDYVPLSFIVDNEAIWDFETGATIACDSILYTLEDNKPRNMTSVIHPTLEPGGYNIKRTIYLKKSDKEK